MGPRSPHVLCSRTESVAEKMLTNWFTFLLYKFLKVGGRGACVGVGAAGAHHGSSTWRHGGAKTLA